MNKLKAFIATTVLGGVTVILPAAILVAVFAFLFGFVFNFISPVTRMKRMTYLLLLTCLTNACKRYARKAR